MKIYIKKDFFLPSLKEYGFKEIQTEKKHIYQNSGLEIDVQTLELKTTSKTDLILFLRMYNDNILEIV